MGTREGREGKGICGGGEGGEAHVRKQLSSLRAWDSPFLLASVTGRREAGICVVHLGGKWESAAHRGPAPIPRLQISVVNRTEEDDFLLLASDGLWDVMGNQV